MDGEALVIAGREGTIQSWNEMATTLFGHRPAEAIGSSLDLIVPESFRERHWIGYERAWRDGIEDAQRIALMPVLCADGETRHFPGHLLPLKGPHGRLAAIAGIYSTPSDTDNKLFTIT